MIEDDLAEQVLHGRVKWFDPGKGFGFVVVDGVPTDVLLHANVLRNFGQSSVADGADISLRVQRTARGIQATEVVSIEVPASAMPLVGEEGGGLTAEEIAACPLEPARVKWYDKGKGFGFANVFGRPEDIFIHAEVLRISGFADLQAGEAIGLRSAEGKRGRMAVQVVSWDMAARKSGSD